MELNGDKSDWEYNQLCSIAKVEGQLRDNADEIRLKFRGRKLKRKFGYNLHKIRIKWCFRFSNSILKVRKNQEKAKTGSQVWQKRKTIQ